MRLTRPLLKDNVQLVNAIDPDLPPVKSDSTRLMQVLFNLVGNASRFTHAGWVFGSGGGCRDGCFWAGMSEGLRWRRMRGCLAREGNASRFTHQGGAGTVVRAGLRG